MTFHTSGEKRKALLYGTKYAGSFLSLICEAGLRADPNNLERLIKAFPEILAKYGKGSMFWSDKSPDLFEDMGLEVAKFPDLHRETINEPIKEV